MAQRVKHLRVLQETQLRSLGWEDPLEKETAAHSSILSWRIPWTEQPGGLQSIASQSQTRLSNYTLTLEICTYVSINTHSKMHIFECFMSRKDAGQRHFQIFSRVYGFAFTVRE